MVAKNPDDRQQTMLEVIAQLEACLRPGPQAAADAMSPSAPLDPGSPQLNPFLSAMSRDAGRSVSVGPASIAVSAVKAAPGEATEVTDDIKSGETDAEKLSKLRIQPPPAPPAISVSITTTPAASRRAAGGMYVAMACAAIIMLGLAAGVVLFLMQGR